MKKRTIFLVLLLSISSVIRAQYNITITVQSKADKELLSAATVSLTTVKKTRVTDSSGTVRFQDLAKGLLIYTVSHTGYLPVTDSIMLANDQEVFITVLLERDEQGEEEEEIIITSTRSTRTIYNIPTRVEFIAGEELDEKSNMKPGDIRMVLNESTGIQTQQTSATSANASIRIQGLDGRYTQILRDGMPLYAGFSGGLGLLQTPPLDLKQFEIIKGSSSTLYGGGAIAGLVNLISKTPAAERELRLMQDVTTAGGWNTSIYYGKRSEKTGVTLFASRNSNAAFDPAGIGLSAIPKFERYTINPKLFIYPTKQLTVWAGLNYTAENRTGGDMAFIKDNSNTGFFERNKSKRISTQFHLDYRFGNNRQLTIKNSFSFFDRSITLPSYFFDGAQKVGFTEATYSVHGETMEWTGGVTLVSDVFRERTGSTSQKRDYHQLTTGLFLQNVWKMGEKVHLESGFRSDFVKDYGTIFLPRLSLLVKYNSRLSSRIGGGMGYKTPILFTEETERVWYRNVLPISLQRNTLEKSYGFNADINYKTELFDDAVDLNFNHLFFYTRISNPLLLRSTQNFLELENIDGYFNSTGMETNVKLGYRDFKLFVGYTYTQTFLHRSGSKSENFLTPRHRLNSVLMYEVEEKWKAGLEAYYYSRQLLSDGQTGKPFWICGFLAEKLWEKFSLYVNFENLLNTRQTRFDTIFTGSINNPVFRDIYAPLDGFVVNGGIKLRL